MIFSIPLSVFEYFVFFVSFTGQIFRPVPPRIELQLYMATKFSRYLLALAQIAAKIDLLTRKYLLANARDFVKTLSGDPLLNIVQNFEACPNL